MHDELGSITSSTALSPQTLAVKEWHATKATLYMTDSTIMQQQYFHQHGRLVQKALEDYLGAQYNLQDLFCGTFLQAYYLDKQAFMTLDKIWF